MKQSAKRAGATSKTAASDIAIPLGIVRSRNARTTLLELIWVLGEASPDDAEVVNTVLNMIRSGRVRLLSGP
jgi:hypothetical protein